MRRGSAATTPLQPLRRPASPENGSGSGTAALRSRRGSSVTRPSWRRPTHGTMHDGGTPPRSPTASTTRSAAKSTSGSFAESCASRDTRRSRCWIETSQLPHNGRMPVPGDPSTSDCTQRLLPLLDELRAGAVPNTGEWLSRLVGAIRPRARPEGCRRRVAPARTGAAARGTPRARDGARRAPRSRCSPRACIACCTRTRASLSSHRDSPRGLVAPRARPPVAAGGRRGLPARPRGRGVRPSATTTSGSRRCRATTGTRCCARSTSTAPHSRRRGASAGTSCSRRCGSPRCGSPRSAPTPRCCSTCRRSRATSRRSWCRSRRRARLHPPAATARRRRTTAPPRGVAAAVRRLRRRRSGAARARPASSVDLVYLLARIEQTIARLRRLRDLVVPAETGAADAAAAGRARALDFFLLLVAPGEPAQQRARPVPRHDRAAGAARHRAGEPLGRALHHRRRAASSSAMYRAAAGAGLHHRRAGAGQDPHRQARPAAAVGGRGLQPELRARLRADPRAAPDHRHQAAGDDGDDARGVARRSRRAAKRGSMRWPNSRPR